MKLHRVTVETKIETSVQDDILETWETEIIESLRKEAVEIARKSYAPYSKFHVGAALRTESGAIVSGSNQENAAYPSGLCAERVTLFYANAHYPNESVTHLLIYAESEELGPLKSPITPCAACRQVLLEKEIVQNKPIKIILVGEEDVYIIPSVKSLVPLSFVPDSLNG